MRFNTYIAVALTLSIFIVEPVFSKGKKTDPDCMEISGLADIKSAENPAFKKAFGEYVKENYSKSVAEFEKVFSTIEEKISALFHGQECDSKKIKAFLYENVYGKEKNIAVTDDGFVFSEEVYLSYASALCFLNQKEKSSGILLKALLKKDTQKLRLAAIVMLMNSCKIEEAKNEMDKCDKILLNEHKISEKLAVQEAKCAK
jgi:hypothetical protein